MFAVGIIVIMYGAESILMCIIGSSVQNRAYLLHCRYYAPTESILPFEIDVQNVFEMACVRKNVCTVQRTFFMYMSECQSVVQWNTRFTSRDII